MSEELKVLDSPGLKNCPFKHTGTNIKDLVVRRYCGCSSEFAHLYYVYCQTCGAHGAAYLTSQWAIEAWNKRVNNAI